MLGDESKLDSSSNPGPSTKIKIGIFNADDDSTIANRLVQKLENSDCEATRFEDLEAGVSKMELLQQFISSQDILIWVATATSLKYDRMMQVARDVAQYAAACANGSPFVVFKSKEHLHLKLPTILSAYVPLKEDEDFDTRLRNSLKSWLKKKQKRKKSADSRSTNHGTGVISRPALTGIAPVSDRNVSEASTACNLGTVAVEPQADSDQPGSPRNPSVSHAVVNLENIPNGESRQSINFTNCIIQQVNIQDGASARSNTPNQN